MKKTYVWLVYWAEEYEGFGSFAVFTTATQAKKALAHKVGGWIKLSSTRWRSLRKGAACRGPWFVERLELNAPGEPEP